MTPPFLPEIAPQCPRCGYDLRGAVAAWRDACPMTGTCTECGLTLCWAEVLVPHKFEPPWCVEFVKPPRRFAWACLGTICRSALPLRFWSALNMSMPVRPRRLGVYVAVLVLPMLLGWIVMQSTVAIRVRLQVQRQVVAMRRQTQPQITFLQGMLADPTLDAATRSRVQGQLAMATSRSVSTGTIKHSYPAAITEAVLLPWRSRSWGTVNYWFGPQPYTSPRSLHFVAMGQSSRTPTVLNTSALVLSLEGIVVAMWIAVTMPLAFVLLPVSRRRAKVRWAHLMRVGCYGLAAGPVLISVIFLLVAVGYIVSGLQPASLKAAHLLARCGITLATVVWWAVAIRRYLHIPHGWAVAPILSILLFVVFVAGTWPIVTNLLQ